MYRPDLLRTVTIALVVALVANLWLWWLVDHDDTFANIIAIASVVAAAAIVVTYIAARRFVDEAYLVAMAVWVANTIEIVTQTDLSAETRLRQGGFYSAFAIVALGAYLTARLRRQAVEP